MFTRKDLIKETLIPCHIVIRTIRDLPVFLEQEDCFRFVFQMYAANIGKPGLNLHRKDINKAATDLLGGRNLSSDLVRIEHNPLVNIISFALAENHAHFILSANEKEGILKFISKLNLGFAKYYNIKNNRKGVLFNRPFKIIPIHGNYQLNTVVCYVNIKTPLEMTESIKDYPFSSFLDLFGPRESKLTAPKSTIKYLGINFENIDKYLNKLKFKDPIFLD
ncbi:hypothetical protein AMJ47_02210 [Parcubacteria bacterium DG_72]|nr:MAG: hypothetical protein AMJ47_02210 [Parcubacteria bacterium DG_72]